MKPHLIGLVGVPGDGKSHMARSAAELGKTCVALTDPKEASFYGPEAQLIWDEDWRPHLGAAGMQAGGWAKLLGWLAERQKDDSKFVVVDTGSEATMLAEHEYLKLQNVFTPGDLEYGKGYIGPESLINGMITELRRLVVRGKTVIVTFHGAMKELEGSGQAKDTVTMAGKVEKRFADQLLPVVSGRNIFAQKIGSAFDLWLYTVPQGYDAVASPGLPEAARAKLARRQFFVTAVPDEVRPAKHSVKFKDGANIARIPNTMKALADVLDEQ